MDIINRIISLLDENGLKPADLCKHLGIKNNVFSTWKARGTEPPTKYIIQICDFFDISPYFLITGQEKRVNNENEVSRTSSLLTSEEYDEDKRDKEELINIFNNLSEREKGELMGYARHMYYQAAPEAKENA